VNKVVCNICGTSYPENASQCPICGFVRTTENAGGNSQDGTYTHVKGGRFSKANVRKRNMEQQRVVSDVDLGSTDSGETGKMNSRKGAIILAVVLLVAIILILGYIALRFFIPNNFLYEGTDSFTTPVSIQDTVPSTTESVEETLPEETEAPTDAIIDCTGITLSDTEFTADSVGSTFTLTVTPTPADTTDEIQFISNDESVATVDANGVVTVTGEGSAVIIVSCGNIEVTCSVTCTPETTEPVQEDPMFTLKLNRKEITFDSEGQSWMLYDGSIAVSAIIWTSDDNSVATITEGKVVAVANGNTTVYGIYEGQTVSCIIHCDFKEEDAGTTGSVSEAVGDTKRVGMLYNPFGNEDDVTMQVDEQFTLRFVDENKNDITDAVWTVKDPEICSYTDGVVKALKTGTTEVTATLDGVSYTCIVRVI